MYYQIGPWNFYPEKFLLEKGTIEKELEPLLFKLLHYFVQNHQRIVTREELAAAVWQQSFVDDNAINRAISELRKQLTCKDYKTVVIKTHYRKGYSINVPVSAIDIELSASEANKEAPQDVAFQDMAKEERRTNDQPRQSLVADVKVASHSDGIKKREDFTPLDPEIPDKKRLFSVGTWFVVALQVAIFTLIAWQFWPSKDTAPSAEPSKEPSVVLKNQAINNLEVNAATYMLGAEYRPKISPSKRLFTFINRQGHQTKSYVHVLDKKIDLELSYQDKTVFAISWQPGQDKLLALLTDSAGYCGFGVFSVPNYSSVMFERVIMSCQEGAVGTAQLSLDGNALFYSTRDQEETGYEVRKFDLLSKIDRIAIPSNSLVFGVRTFSLSPDGSKMMYQREAQGKKARIYLYDLNSHEHKKVYTLTDQSTFGAADWYLDNEHILIKDQRNFVIVNVDDLSKTTLLMESDWPINSLSTIADKQILFTESGAQKMSLKMSSSPFNLKDTSSVEYRHQVSEGTNYYPVISGDDTYFISSRTGQSQIWRHTVNSAVKQVTQFELTRQFVLYPPVVSSDNKYLMFRRDDRLEVLDIATSTLNAIEGIDGSLVNTYEFSKDGRKIYYALTNNNTIQLWQFDLITRENTQVTAESIVHVLSAPSGEVFYLEKDRLVSIDGKTVQRLPFSSVRCVCQFVLTNDYLYTTDAKDWLYRLELSTGEYDKRPLPEPVAAIAVSDNDEYVIYQTETQLETQIKRLSWD